jgi:hypothetical protein
LSFQELDFRVDALGAAVVMSAGHRGVDGVAIEIEPSSKGVQMGQIFGLLPERSSRLAVVGDVGGCEQGGEGAHQVCDGGHFGAGCGEGVEVLALPLGELSHRYVAGSRHD